MRRSFDGGSSGSMLRSVRKALVPGGAAPPEPISPFASSRKPKQFISKQQTAPANAALTLSSTGSPSNRSSDFSMRMDLPKSGASGAAATTWASCSDGDDTDTEWNCVDVIIRDDDQRAVLFCDDFVFGTLPSTGEVNYAISALQQIVEPYSPANIATQELGWENEGNTTDAFEQTSSSSESASDWIEPSLYIHGPRMLQTYGLPDRVYEAFHLLQTEPSVQRMVFALSSDKAVWDAVLNNEVVKELRGTIIQGDEEGRENSTDKASDDDTSCWFLVNTKAMIMKLGDKITRLANEVFQPANADTNEGDGVDSFREKLKASLLLSIIVLLIVVITRAESA